MHLGPSPKRQSLGGVHERVGSPDVLCLQELHMRERDADELRLAEDALPGYRFVHSLADDPLNAKFRGGRVYGVGTYARAALDPIPMARLPWDREGRVVVTVLPHAKLAVINVYAVNGTDKPYYEDGVVRGTRHDWKRRFHDHVADLGLELVNGGLDLLLIGDWNVSQTRIDITPRLRTEEPHATNRAHFAEHLVKRLDVVDVFRELHPEARAYTWFNPRSRRLDAARVDYALLSRSRLKRVRSATIDESLRDDLGSDHVPLHIELT